jgi:hypothetical protein
VRRLRYREIQISHPVQGVMLPEILTAAFLGACLGILHNVPRLVSHLAHMNSANSHYSNPRLPTNRTRRREDPDSKIRRRIHNLPENRWTILPKTKEDQRVS